MKIEKMITREGDSNYATRSKINEIIDELNLTDILCTQRYDEIDERLSDLEQCPVDDVTPIQYEIIKCSVNSLGNHICRIEDKLNSFISLGELGSIKEQKEQLDLHKEKLENIYDYINYFKEKAILKPEYDPDDVKLTGTVVTPSGNGIKISSTQYDYEIAEEGTFEWALIQMKNGKKVIRQSQESNMFVYIDCTYKLNQYKGKCNTIHNKIDWEVILATDWEIVE